MLEEVADREHEVVVGQVLEVVADPEHAMVVDQRLEEVVDQELEEVVGQELEKVVDQEPEEVVDQVLEMVEFAADDLVVFRNYRHSLVANRASFVGQPMEVVGSLDYLKPGVLDVALGFVVVALVVSAKKNKSKHYKPFREYRNTFN